MSDLIKARIYLAETIFAGRPIDRQYISSLTGLIGGPLHRFVTQLQSELPPSRVSKASKSGRTQIAGWEALAAKICEEE